MKIFSYKDGALFLSEYPQTILNSLQKDRKDRGLLKLSKEELIENIDTSYNTQVFFIMGQIKKDYQEKINNLPIKYFLANFKYKKKCRLIMKCNIIYGVEPTLKNEIESFISENEGRVELITSNLSEEEMAKLFKSTDCYISPSLVEGFGMQILENMACGTPCLITGWTGEKEFTAGVDSIIHIDKDEEKLKLDFFPYEGQEWDQPNINDFTKKLEYVYENIDDLRKKALINAPLLNEKYNWTAIVDKLERAFEQVISSK